MHSLRKWLLHEDGGASRVRGVGDGSWGNLDAEGEDKKESLWTQFWHVILGLIWPRPPPEDDLDLVVTRPQGRVDGLTRWVVWQLIPFWVELQARKQRSRRQSDPEKDANDASSRCAWPRRKPRKSKKLAQVNGKLKIQDPKYWRKKTTKQQTIQIWSEKGALRFTAGISMIVACLLPVAAITVLANMHTTRDLLLCLAGFTVIFAVGLMFLTAGTISRVEIFTATAA
jgi:hypothetical protein